jgi:outer membrane protein TolC
LQKVLAGTQKRFQAGFASKTDIAEIRNEILTVNRELERLKLLETEQRLRWRSDTGNRAAKKLSWPNVKKLVPSSAQATVRKAVSDNPVINISNSEAASEQYRAKAGMAEFLPRVDLYGRVSREHAEPSSTRENDYEYSIGARLTVPLIDVASTARYRRSKERALASRYRAQDTERQIRRDVELAWNSLQSSRRQETLIKQQISTSRQIKAGLIREYEAGLRPVSDYLLHEVELAKLRQELVANRINTVTLAWQIALQFGSVSLAELTS